MYLKNLSLLNFKNLTEANFEFAPTINCFLGNNGEGKTNLLDAIHYLSFTKSYFNSFDSQNIKFGEPFFVVQGSFVNNDEKSEIYCGLKSGEKKQFRKNKKNYKKLSEHIGQFPVVMISPNDISLILEGSEVRRKFMDSLISQFDRDYLKTLLGYNRIVTQRNALLKQFAERGNYQETLLDVLDMQLVPLGARIHELRQTFLNDFIPVFNNFYRDLTNAKETVSLEYKSQLNDNSYERLLHVNRSKDLMSTYTTMGVHKDDLIFTIGEHPLKKFGSQGQQKSYLIALKLASHSFITNKKGYPPILLLDDIFDKLDELRINYLLKMISEGKLGQTFITDTSTEKVPEILNNINLKFNAFAIESGAIKEQLI